MIQKTTLEMQKANALKALRTGIRLKYALLADEEINDRLPALEKEIDRALAEGEPLEITLGALIDAA